MIDRTRNVGKHDMMLKMIWAFTSDRGQLAAEKAMEWLLAMDRKRRGQP